MAFCRQPTRRSAASALPCLALTLLAALSAAPAAAATGVAAPVPATAPADHRFTRLFTVPRSGNQQGLAYADGIHYVAFDTGNGYGEIVAYDDAGEEVKRTPRLRLGHAAEVSHRAADGNLYVAVYGAGRGLEVAVVDMRPATPRIVRTYDFSSLGDRGMVAVDNARDELVVKSGPKQGPHTFTTTDMQGRVLQQFTDVSQGLGQGLEVLGDDLLLYTSAPDFRSSTITVYSRTGTVQSKIHVPVPSEGEGLSVDHRTGHLHVGFRNHAVHRMSPAYRPSVSLTDNRLVNGGADSSAPGRGDAGPVPGWTATGGMRAVRYGADDGYPSLAGARPAEPGSAFFSGGTSPAATVSQVVSTWDVAAAIDAGTATYQLSGWLGGYRWQTDRAQVVATFRDGAGAAIGSTSIGPVTAEERNGATGLHERAVSGEVPAGTRSVLVVVTAVRGGGTNNDGYVDGLALLIG